MIAHQVPDDGMSGRVQSWLLAARIWLGGHAPGGAVWAPHLLHTLETHAEHVGHGALGAKSPLAGAENLLTSINRVRSHIAKALPDLSYDQVKTAIISLTATVYMPIPAVSFWEIPFGNFIAVRQSLVVLVQ